MLHILAAMSEAEEARGVKLSNPHLLAVSPH
jgi:hypothetical protein